MLGTASAFDAPARQSFVSEIVDPDDLTNAVGLNSASFNAARLVGPGLAGVLIAAFGGGAVATGWVILLNAVIVRRPDPGPARPGRRRARQPGAGRPRPRRDPRGRRLRPRPPRPDARSWRIVFFAGTFGLNFQMTSALMATEVFGKGPTEYGLLGTFLAVGSLTGALVAARRAHVRHRLVIGAGARLRRRRDRSPG